MYLNALYIILVLLILWHIRGWYMSRVEHPQIQVETSYDSFSIINMPAHIVARVRVQGSLTSAPSKGFGLLAGYIFGDNTRSDTIAMTAPVTSQAVQDGEKIAMTAPVTSKEIEDGEYEISFIMPSEWSIETLPTPHNERVELQEIPASRKAVWTFNGYAQKYRVAAQWEKFQQALKKENIVWSGYPTLAQYNDPWTPPLMRRNELWVDVK